MIPEPRGGNEPEGEGGSLAVLTVLALIVGAISGAAGRRFHHRARTCGSPARGVCRLGACVWVRGVLAPGHSLRRGGRGRRGPGAPDLAPGGRQRHPPCRSRPERPIARGALSRHSGQVHRRRARHRFRACAWPRGAEPCTWPRRSAISSAKSFGAAGPTAGFCSPRGRAPASPPHSTRRSPAASSCSRSWCGGSNCGSRSPRSAPRRPRSPSPGRSSATPRTSIWARLSRRACAVRPLFFVLGALAGLIGVLYNRALLRTMARSTASACRSRRGPG